MISFKCLFGGHVYWEHWNYQEPPIDHCVTCGKEKPHKTKDCTCTICNYPGGLKAFKDKWVISKPSKIS